MRRSDLGLRARSYLETERHGVVIDVPFDGIYNDDWDVFQMHDYGDGRPWPRTHTFEVPFLVQFPTGSATRTGSRSR